MQLSLASQVSARIWYIKVDGSGDAPTIQAGVDSSAAGDTVLVASGVYSDSRQILINGEPKEVNVYINRNIKLICDSTLAKARIDASNSDVAIFVENVDSTGEISNFIISSWNEGIGCIIPFSRTSQSKAIMQYPVREPIAIKSYQSSIVIWNNEFIENATGIEVNNHSCVKIYNNEFSNNQVGIACIDSSNAEIQANYLHDGIYLILCYLSFNQRIVNNVIIRGKESCYGIFCLQASAYIGDNYIDGMTNAGIYCNDSNSIIEHNWIQKNFVGISNESSTTGIIRFNAVVNSYQVAIDLIGYDGLIENNTIYDCLQAIMAQGGSDPLIQKNIIANTSGGVSCIDVSQPAFYCNNIFDADDLYYGNCSAMTGSSGNISVDPEFCGIPGSDNYFLQSDSPCAPGNHPDSLDCGLIGAFDVKCGLVDVEDKSWGSIKAIFKGRAKDTLRE